MDLLNFNDKIEETQTKTVTFRLDAKDIYGAGEKFRTLNIFEASTPTKVLIYYPTSQEELLQNIDDGFKAIVKRRDIADLQTAGGHGKRQTRRFRPKRQHRRRPAKSRRHRA